MASVSCITPPAHRTDQDLCGFGISRKRIYRAPAMREVRSAREQQKLQELLRQLRVDAGLRQIDVARELGLPQSMVSKYEIGERRLDMLEIRDLCRLFGIGLLDFVKKFEELMKDEK
jgi:transcriptional regulator with XRE-family HTH domain